MMKTEVESKKKKRPYKKPELKTIELAAREVLAAGCKLDGGGNNFGDEPCNIGSCAGVDAS